MGSYPLAPTLLPRYFEPAAATASFFLYAQGQSVIVANHDTLGIERRFARHSEEVQLLAVDTQSDIGAGRLVVSYDAGQTAIVWDLMTGDEIARFASYENLTTAAWMRNGNVAFGTLLVRCSGLQSMADRCDQETHKEISFSLSQQPRNTFQQGPLIKYL